MRYRLFIICLVYKIADMGKMQEDLKHKSVADIWKDENVNSENQLASKTKKLVDRMYNIKLELIKDLQKQHDTLHKAKLNICITIDNQKRKLRREIEILKAEICLKDE